MAEEDNGTVPEQPGQPLPAPPQSNLDINIVPGGAVLTFPVQLGMDNVTMKQLVKQYLAAHPELVQEIAREAIVQRQQELKFIQMINRSRND